MRKRLSSLIKAVLPTVLAWTAGYAYSRGLKAGDKNPGLSETAAGKAMGRIVGHLLQFLGNRRKSAE